MAEQLSMIRSVLEGVSERAHDAKDDALITMVSLIASQLHMIEGCKTQEEQMVGCQQLSNSILVVQMMQASTRVRELDELRVAIGQFGYMGI